MIMIPSTDCMVCIIGSCADFVKLLMLIYKFLIMHIT